MRILHENVSSKILKNLKEGSEVLRTYSKDSKEYKALQKFCDELNSKSTKTKYYLKDIYFDYGQNWMYTAIIADSSDENSVSGTWQAVTPREYEKIIYNNGKADDVLERLISKNG